MTTFSGQEIVSAGQTVSGVTIVKRGAIWVQSGGTALRTTVRDGALIVGGQASRTIVGSSGYVSVGGGGEVFHTRIQDGGRVVVDYRANAVDTVIESGGVEILSNYAWGYVGHPLNYAGGHQRGGTIENGGVLIATRGASLEDLTIKSGGELVFEDSRTPGYTAERGAVIAFMEVMDGARAVHNTVSDFTQTVHSGASAIGTRIVNGTQIISSGGRANSSVLGKGGNQIVGAGGQVFGTLISKGGSQTVYGKVNKTTIENGGLQTLSGGSVAQNVTINSGGVEVVRSGAIAGYVKIESGGTLKLVGGNVTKVTVETGGVLQAVDVVSGMTVRSSVVDRSYNQSVRDGGTVIDTTVFGGVQTVLKGGRALDTSVVSGFQKVEGYAANTSVSYGKQDVQHGKVINTFVAISGIQTITGGLAFGTVVGEGGIQLIERKGVSTRATISSGGVQQVDRGGIARGTTVLSGGEVMYNGGEVTGAYFQSGSTEAVRTTVDNIKIDSGVTLAVLPGGIVSNSTLRGGAEVISAYANIRNGVFIPTNVTFASSSNLSIQETPFFNGPFVLSLSGFGSGSTLDLGGFQVGKEEKFVFAQGSGGESTLTITDGQLTANITLFGQYVAAGFHHASDGAGGTLITYAPPPLKSH